MRRQAGLIALLLLATANQAIVAGERNRMDAKALTAEIDRLVLEKLKAAGVSPASRCDDATFIRRLNLALGGRVPVSSEVRLFVAIRLRTNAPRRSSGCFPRPPMQIT